MKSAQEVGEALASAQMKGLQRVEFSEPPEMLQGLQIHWAEEALGHSPLTRFEFAQVLESFQAKWRRQLGQ